MAINVSELDFTKIKTNIISSYESDPRFKDYDFKGSTLSLLVDILAYVTHYQGVYSNMALSERFLDSAQLRNSVVSLAKEIGYFPSQTVSSKARVNITTDATNISGNPPTLWVFNQLAFTGTNTSNQTYEFLSNSTFELYKSSDGLTYSGMVDINEGSKRNSRFVYDAQTRSEFVLIEPGIDVDTIIVRVKSSSADNDANAITWSYSKNAIFNGGSDTVYFLEEAGSNSIRLFFGDGVVGKAISDGNEIIVDYITCSGSKANQCAGFVLGTSVEGIASNQFITNTTTTSNGGSDQETITTIKQNAPSNYAAQERAVTVEDFRSLLISKFPFIESISVWGGEDNIPRKYGQVFIAVKPNYGDVLDSLGKNNILTYLKTVAIVGTGINIVQPKLIYVNTTSTVTYLRSLTADSGLFIEKTVDDAIINYFTSNTTNTMNLNVKYSKLLQTIDNSHPSISSNITSLSLTSRFIPDTLHSQNLTIDMANSLVPGTIVSDTWVDISGNVFFLKDDGAGTININENGIEYQAIYHTPHTVDYTTGVIKLNQFKPAIAPGTTININGNTKSNDILSSKDVILKAGTQNTTVIGAA